MPTVNFPKLSSSEAEERTNAVSEPAVLLASLIPEDLPKREREKEEEEEEERYPFKEMTIG